MTKIRKKKVKLNPHFLDYFGDWGHFEYFLLGGYGSGKSFTTADKIISKCNEEVRKVLVIRDTFASHRDSTYEDLVSAISHLHLDEHFTCTKSPLKITCDNGSVILFRGLDDVKKLKSIKDISIIWVK